MRNPATDSTGAFLPSSETAVNLARTAFTVSNSVIVLYMAIIQYLLVRIRFSKSKITPPTPTETYAAVTVLWIVHRLLDTLLSTAIDRIIQIFWEGETASHYHRLRYGAAFDIGYWNLIPVTRTWRSNFTLIFWEVMVTWLISLNINLSIFFAPRILEARQRPGRVFARCRKRLVELARFMGILFQDADPILHFGSTKIREVDIGDFYGGSKEVGQKIELQRHQDENRVEGERTLNWDLSVDKEALDEMMETLGPPGAFGELGFHISKGKVCFGAMGVGTRFNLTFGLETGSVDEK